MTKHEIVLYWSNEDEAFIAEVPELPGCAADGATRQEAIAQAEIVIAECFTRILVGGESPAHQRGGRVELRIDARG